MINYLLLGLFISLDNLRVSLSLGTAELSAHQRQALPVSFGLFEAGMPLLGLLLAAGAGLAGAEFGEYIEMAGLLAVAGLMLSGAVWGNGATKWLNSRWALAGLPLLFSVDNLFAGAALAVGSGASAVGGALLVGAISGGTAAAGLYLGTRLRDLLPHPQLTGAALLIVLSIPAFYLG